MGDSTRGDIKSSWSTRVGMRVLRSHIWRSFMNILFFSLKLEHHSFTMYRESYQGGTTSWSKGKGGVTTYCPETICITEEGNAYNIKWRGSNGLKYEIMSLGQSPTSSLEEFEAIYGVWVLSTWCWWELCVREERFKKILSNYRNIPQYGTLRFIFKLPTRCAKKRKILSLKTTSQNSRANPKSQLSK